jgi:hypothetical protein
VRCEIFENGIDSVHFNELAKSDGHPGRVVAWPLVPASKEESSKVLLIILEDRSCETQIMGAVPFMIADNGGGFSERLRPIFTTSEPCLDGIPQLKARSKAREVLGFYRRYVDMREDFV